MTHLHIFALNAETDVTHTNLTRQKGETPNLPPLDEWLGVDSLDTDDIELFPISELGGMDLSDYVQLAFAPNAIAPDIRARLDALEGSVLLVPEAALSGPAQPGTQVTRIASLPLAKPDHDAVLPTADVRPTAHAAPLPTEREATPPVAFFALIAMAVFAALAYFIGWN